MIPIFPGATVQGKSFAHSRYANTCLAIS